MKKFTFTLQALLQVTASLEKEQKNQLSIINNVIKKLEDEHSLLMSEISSSICAYLEEIKVSLSVSHIKMHNDYLRVLNGKIQSVLKKIEEQNIEKHKLQDLLVETMTRRKSLEKLKDKQYKSYLKELQKEEEKIIDDFASYSFVQN